MAPEAIFRVYRVYGSIFIGSMGQLNLTLHLTYRSPVLQKQESGLLWMLFIFSNSAKKSDEVLVVDLPYLIQF